MRVRGLDEAAPGLAPFAQRSGAALLVTLLHACGGGGSAEDSTAVYRTGFDGASEPKWLTVSAADQSNCVPLAVRTNAPGDTFAVSEGPWWVDGNHAPPGLGYLNLVAFAYYRDWSEDGEIPSASSDRPLDLRGAEVIVRWRAPALKLPEASRLLFWFQTLLPATSIDEERYVNYVVERQPLVVRPGDASWQEARLLLSEDRLSYRCLGSSSRRSDTYTCADDPLQALKDWNVDLGFVILFADAKSAAAVEGSVEFDEIRIEVPGADSHRDDHVQPAPSARPSTCRGPQPA